MLGSTPLGPVMIDIQGTSLTEDDIRRINHPNTGGVILFARNFETRKKLTWLNHSIKKLRPGIIIAVDHEGGRVQRFKTDGFTHLPPMRVLGKYWEHHPERGERLATAIGFILASELRSCGIDLSFTPVLDLDYGNSRVIGDRSLGKSPTQVTALAKSLIVGMQRAGMSNCGKHFPGHGYVDADSHIEMPVDARELDDILRHDTLPYGLLEGALTAVMPAHVVYPKVDNKPAGFSSKWLSILRNQLGFNGVIFSDDLSMEGARKAGTVTDSANAALAAGCDMVLVCNAPEQADIVLNEMNVPDAWSSSRARLEYLIPSLKTLSWEDLKQDPQYLQAKSRLADLV